MPVSDVVLNEILASHTGTDNTEFVELFGPAGTSLDGASFIAVESDVSNNGTVDARIDFTAADALDADGFFLVGNPAGLSTNYAATPDIDITTNTLENSSVTYALVDTAALEAALAGAGVGSLSGDDVFDTFALSDGDAADSFFFGAPVVGPDGSFFPAGARRIMDGFDTDQANDFVLSDFFLGLDNTPGASNPEEMVVAPVAATIMEIQGAGHVSPFVDLDLAELPDDTFNVTGALVETTGVVTAVDGRGFYMQDLAGDGDDETSDGIFVFTDSSPGVALGEFVTVEGTVSEFFPGDSDTGNLPITQIVDPTVIAAIVALPVLPGPVIIGAAGRTPPTEEIDDDGLAFFNPDEDGADFLESLEGMLVTVDDPLVVAGTNRFGEIFTVADFGADATGLSDRNTINIAPDDFNPERIQIDTDFQVSPGGIPDVAAGALLEDVTGVVGFSFGNYEVVPTEDVVVLAESPLAPEVTALSGSDDVLTVASYNVLNLDPTVEDPANVDPTEADPEDEVDDDVGDGRFDAIAEHIVTNLGQPDIIGLQEVQNNDGAEVSGVASADQTLQTLVDAIVAAGGQAYEFIDTPDVPVTTFDGTTLTRPVGGQPGGDIRNAYLYNPARVDLVPGSVDTLEDGDDDPFPFFEGRIPLIAEFEFGGETVTIVNNHFSSKGGSAPLFGTEQPFDALQEDPDVNGSLAERRKQAAAVAEFVAGELAGDPEANVIVLGDLNEFEFVSPVEILGEAGHANLTDTLPEDERYTFIFQGNSQSLDHILVSDALVGGAEFDIVHVNSEFAADAGRASDHDPLLAALDLGDGGPTVVAAGPGDEKFDDLPGDTTFLLGDESDLNVLGFGDLNDAANGEDVIVGFDIDGGGETSADRLEFELSGVSFGLETTEDVLAAVSFIEFDGDGDTDAIIDGTDLVFDVVGSSSIRLVGVVDGDSLTRGQLIAAGADDAALMV